MEASRNFMSGLQLLNPLAPYLVAGENRSRGCLCIFLFLGSAGFGGIRTPASLHLTLKIGICENFNLKHFREKWVLCVPERTAALESPNYESHCLWIVCSRWLLLLDDDNIQIVSTKWKLKRKNYGANLTGKIHYLGHQITVILCWTSLMMCPIDLNSKGCHTYMPCQVVSSM